MKRAIAFLCSLVLAFTLIPTGYSTFAVAKETDTGIITNREIVYTPQYYAAPTVQNTALEKAVYNAIINMQSSLDVSKYSIKKNDFLTLYYAVFDKYPELYNSNGFRYEFIESTEQMLTIYFNYHYVDKAQVDQMNTAWRKVADSLLATVKNNKNLDTVEKMLLLHDKLAAMCEYDEETLENFNNNKATNPDAFNMYGTLVRRKSVCQGYAKTYQYLLNQLGIENYLCSSQKLNHVWNIAKLDGEYYHIDVTFDDPIKDIEGQVMHNNFLVSTEKLKQTGHNADDFDTDPDDTKYDNAFWRDSNTEFCLIGNDIYYFNSSYPQTEGIHRWDNADDSDVLVHKSNNMNSLTRITADGNNLLFNDRDKIYSFDPLSPETVTPVLVPTFDSATMCIAGFERGTTKYIIDYIRYSDSSLITENVTFTEGKVDLTEAFKDALADINLTVTYSGTAYTPYVVVMYGGVALDMDIDYIVSYKNNVNAGTGKITLTGVNDFKGTASADIIISPKAITSVSNIGDRAYTGKSITFNPLVKCGSKVLVKNTDYTLSFSNNKNVGTASITVRGKGNYKGTFTKKFLIRPAKITGIKQTAATYNSITLSWSKTGSATGYAVLRASSKNGTYYVVKYISGTKTTKYVDTKLSANKTYYYKVLGYVTVSGKKYAGADSSKISAATATKTPSKPTLSKNTKKKKITVKWKKVTGASGYQVYMRTGKKGSYKRIYTGTKLNYTKTKLKKGTRYYFRVRTYKTVNGVKYYSSYSSAKSIKL